MSSADLFRPVAAAGVLVLVLAACGSDDEPTGAPSAPAPTTPATTSGAAAPAQSDTIQVKDYAFSPRSAAVKAGTTVTWTFADDAEHNVEPVGASELQKSPDLQGGGTYTFTLSRPGTVEYRCGIHNSMTGSVVVTA